MYSYLNDKAQEANEAVRSRLPKGAAQPQTSQATDSQPPQSTEQQPSHQQPSQPTDPQAGQPHKEQTKQSPEPQANPEKPSKPPPPPEPSKSPEMSQNEEQSNAGDDPRSPDQQKQDNELAIRLSSIIEDANNRTGPLCQMIRKHIENMFEKPEDERDEAELVKEVKPLLQQAEQILNETNGSIKGADPDNRLSNQAKRNQQDHKATPEEQRLAEALKILVEDVGGTIEWAKDKLDSFPKAKRDLGPLLDALGAPLTQIVGGVGLLLAGVLNLVGKLLSGLGLDSLFKGIVAATGLDKMFSSLGLGKWLNSK